MSSLFITRSDFFPLSWDQEEQSVRWPCYQNPDVRTLFSPVQSYRASD